MPPLSSIFKIMYNKRMSENDKIDELSEQVLKDATNFQARRELVIALMEKGYNPINQIVGYIISGDPGYISSYKDSRKKIVSLDRSELVALILEDYLEKN